MGSGQKAWAEELEQEAWESTKKKFQEVPQTQAIQLIQDTLDDLQRFVSSDPALTKLQWFRIENCIKRCKVLV